VLVVETTRTSVGGELQIAELGLPRGEIIQRRHQALAEAEDTHSDLVILE